MLIILDDGGWGVITAHYKGCPALQEEGDLDVCECEADIFSVPGEIPEAA